MWIDWEVSLQAGFVQWFKHVWEIVLGQIRFAWINWFKQLLIYWECPPQAGQRAAGGHGRAVGKMKYGAHYENKKTASKQGNSIQTCKQHESKKTASSQGIGEYTPQKLRNSHCCVPFTATFSKRRKIGSLWSERCDTVEGFQGQLSFNNWAKIVPLRLHLFSSGKICACCMHFLADPTHNLIV